MNPQQKKLAMIVGGVGAAVVLVIVLFVTLSGHKCTPNVIDDKNKVPTVDAKSVSDLTGEKYKVKINARLEFSEKGEGDKAKTINYYVASDANKLSEASDGKTIDVQGTCIKSIAMSINTENDKRTIDTATFKIENQKHFEKDGKEVTCTAKFKTPLDIPADKYLKCEKGLELTCQPDPSDPKTLGTLKIPVFYFGNKDADFSKDDHKHDC